MEKEEKPDREGYLNFKVKVEQGDLALRLRAGQDWHNDSDNPQTPLASYFELFCDERRLDAMYNSPERKEQVARNAATQLLRIRNDALLQKTAKDVAARIERWEQERFDQSCNFLEVHEWGVRRRAEQWQAAHPDATESQSWFAGKTEAIEAHLNHAHVLENTAVSDVQKIIEAAVARERLESGTDPGFDDIPRRKIASRDRDGDRER
jgi:hypothetical protein